tara:strand:- start:643 stop:960 length:318 start_codon:yes stop_codon:yes gene_type:complete
MKESIIRQKMARKKIASKMAREDTIDSIIYIGQNTAFLKSIQKKQLTGIIAKAYSNESITLQDNLRLLEMKGTIRVYMVASEANVDSHSNRLERYSVTYDHKNNL